MRWLSLTLLLMFFMLSRPASATVSISLSGSAENSSAALEKANNHSVSANIGLSLGRHFMVGLTHRRSYENKTGHKRATDTANNRYEYIAFEDKGETITNSVDLTIIPYTGLISPFIFGGVARRDYYNRFEYLDRRIETTQILFPIPNYGGGIAIRLGMGFELKLTQTYTPGLKTTLDPETSEEKDSKVMDTYTQLWLGYKI